ncbi:rabphilin-3A isoform X1 [Fopius arisanus]|uniref:Rabphilin-3A isoform X1 n=1 Tax=Fopius arisanus TaxID=64838 RepID=A0A9R1T7F5_9HYME|nr:PREDICTED: rabphilin-3A isoform X1 [Fopius arisanus]
MDASYYSGVKRSGSGRWVCPNDRQLALRAKLRTGWSVKSASLDSRTYEYSRCSTTSCPSGLSSSSSSASLPLSDAERERIIQVIQRAEALDLSEQERVGKLVERLENMKRNVTVVTSTRATNRNCGSRCIRNNRCMCCCALCGEKFTVLGAGPTLCRDCRKYVCQKCGVETCRASRSSTTNLQTHQRRGTSASINNLPSAEVSGSASKQLVPSKVFLCRICTETREMWKKSGAWFFKSLPKYVLPEKKVKKPRGSSRSAGWTLTGGSKSLEPSEHDSSSDEEISRKPTRTRSFLSYSLSTDPDLSSSPKPELEVEVHIEPQPKRTSSEVHEQPETLGHLQVHHTPQCQLIVPNNSSSSTSPSSPISSTSPLPPSRSSSRLRDQSTSQTSIFYVRNAVGSSESVNHESSSQCESTKSSLRGRKSSSQGNSVDRAHSRGSLEFSDGSSIKHGSRRPSINSNGSSETDAVLVSRYDQDRSQQWGYRRTESVTGTVEKAEEEKNLGTLEIALRYESASQCLHCKVERARGLRAMDIHGLADPFCKLNILPIDASTTTTRRLRTKTVHKTRDPEFNEQLNFYGIMENDLKSGKALHILILQDDPAGRDFLGEARFPLRELQPSQTKFYNVLLEDHYQVDQEERVWGEDMTNGRGVINVSLSYSTRRRALLVTINRAHDLLPMDSNGLSDPFVKLCLTKDPRGDDVKRPPIIQNSRDSPARRHSKKSPIVPKCIGVTHTTSVKWKTLNPEWNEEFAFETRLTDLTANALVLTVWDKDFGKSNDYLGGLVLSCNSKGTRLRHWIDAIKFPDHRHHCSHELVEDIGFHE